MGSSRSVRVGPLGLMAGASAFVLTVAACRTAVGAAAWVVPEQPLRFVFTPPATAGMHVLVRLPLPADCASNTAVAVYDAAGQGVPHRSVYRQGDARYMLAAIGPSPQPPFAVYYGRPGTNTGEVADLADPLPVSVSVYPSPAQGIPNTWEKMLFMVGQYTVAPLTFRQHYFGDVTPPTPEVHERYRAQGAPIVKLQTFLLCSREGPYRFAVDCRDAGFVLVDGQVAAARPGEGPQGTWATGSPVYLKPGVHLLEVFSKARQTPWVRVGWQPSTAGSPVALPHGALLCSSDVSRTRLERQDDVVHPDFTFTLGRTYAFRDCDDLFTPVRFDSRYATYGSGSRMSWLFGDGGTGEGPRAEHIFRAKDRYVATLSVVTPDGRAYGCEGVVDCRYVEAERYAFTARLAGLPAVCYEGDAVEPQVRLESRNVPALPVTLRWTIEFSDGSDTNGATPLTFGGDLLRFPLTRAPAGRLRSVSWRLVHAGATVASETVRVERPADTASSPLPRVEGEMLRADGDTRVVYLPQRYAGRFTQRRIGADDLAAGVVCVDDTLAGSDETDALGAAYPHLLERELAAVAAAVPVTHRALADWCESVSAYGPLLNVVGIPAAAGGREGVAVISVGRQDMAFHTDPGEFERVLAAAVDRVTAAGAGRPVVLVTPPAYPSMGADARAYAAAVMNVAIVRGVPVADLYSACMGAGTERASLFRDGSDLALSVAGQRLAARLVAGVLAGRRADTR